ncbi:hypothetical protein NKR23_g9694 [Pleurostoma richardsiae]|uniref:Ipa protein n=1 Tax=Pleurostoma richardsiae TaxID=41990 RepID=A0AA38RM85_9PEZI|nr:hypothetical protein NKR23_g9694 [Pleurostoma richardsiae]
MADEWSKSNMVRELHGDLVQKYRLHGPKIEELWRSFGKAQRMRCIKAAADDGRVLKNTQDTSMGNVFRVSPEWNLRDLTKPESDLLLRILKHRATQSLSKQFIAGVDGSRGDRDFVLETRGFDINDIEKDFCRFHDDGRYGDPFTFTINQIQEQHLVAIVIGPPRDGYHIPRQPSILILHRQFVFLKNLNSIVGRILEEDSKANPQPERPKKSEEEISAALTRITIQAPPTKLSVPDLLTSARDQRAALEEHLALLSTEPVVLAHAVNSWLHSQPEFVIDEKGRRFPAHTDKSISGAVFEAVHGAIQGAAVWNYITCLLELLESSDTDKVCRVVVLQEISNICHLEYVREQALFKRHVQTGFGSKCFKRISYTNNRAGVAHVTMKGKPEAHTRSNPQLHYMLRLCQTETTASKAVDWMKMLIDLQEAHPEKREMLEEREADALCDLAVIVGFIHDLSPVISMPTLSRKKGQAFVSRFHELDVELNQLKKQVDLREFAAPVTQLLQPGMAEETLNKLDQSVTDMAGTKMGFLYQDLVDDSFSDLQSHLEQLKAKIQDAKTDWQPIKESAPETPEKRVEQRRQKEKTRPSHSSVYEITPRKEPAAAEEGTPPAQTFKVSSSSAEAFSTLFKKSESRGSVNWVAFESAMAELGFSVVPTSGSAFTFFPPSDMGVKKSFTIHRPHKSRIEGYLIPIFARRLMRLYGWGEHTFEVA